MCRLGVALVLAAALVLAGCGRERPVPPAPTSVPPTLSPATTVVSDLPRQIGTEGRYQVFEVSPQQYELIGRRVPEVLVRQHLWDQGVRFGANYVPEKRLHFVMIDPGFSGLTAREILDRLLGII